MEPDTVKVSEPVRVREPEVPVKTTDALAATADVAAAKLTVCGTPGVSVKVTGVAVTPVGSPEIATAIVAEKPLAGTAVRLIDCEAPPAVRLALG